MESQEKAYEIYVCDNDVKCVAKIEKIIGKLGKKLGIKVNITKFYSTESLLFLLEEKVMQVELLYIAHRKNGFNGINAVRRFRQWGYKGEVLYFAEEEKEIAKGFDTVPLWYFSLGWIDRVEEVKEQFQKGIQRAKKKRKEYFSYSSGGKLHKTHLSEILYFEADGHQISMCFKSGEKKRFYGSIGKLEEILSDKGFIRIHRSYLIRRTAPLLFRKNQVVIGNKTKLCVGTTYREQAYRQLLGGNETKLAL